MPVAHAGLRRAAEPVCRTEPRGNGEIDRGLAETDALKVCVELLESSDPERDAWYVTKLVMAVFHHYAYADGLTDAHATAEELWEFCLRALGGRVA